MDASAVRPPPSRPSGWGPALGAAGIIAAALAAYRNAWHGPFLYDDAGAILNNPTLRRLGDSFFPPAGGFPVSGRPLANFSLALNYAWGGLRVEGFHALSIGIHLAAGLALFGIVRRTLLLPSWGLRQPAAPAEAAWIGFLAALLWTVHPLQTEAVSYLSQRAEELMGLFYLLMLYCFLRGASEGRRPWLALSWLACLGGMASKEVMATAPVMVLLYDRAFLSGSFSAAWRERRGYYLGLASTWGLLAWLVAANAGRGGTAGYASAVGWLPYAFTQFRAIAIYLRLSLWPSPLIFDYGRMLGGPLLPMAASVATVATLAVVVVILLRRNSPLGFLGAWFLLILAPSSSVVPVATEIIAEHRAYLSLAAVAVAVVWAGAEVIRRRGGKPALGIAAALAVTTSLAAATIQRNRAYGSVLALWADVVAKEPGNAGARNNYGNALAEQGRLPEAIGQFQAALRLAPDYDDAHYDLANALVREGRGAEAIGHYEAALRFEPQEARIHYALGAALRREGRAAEAERQFEEALGGRSDSAAVWYDLGNAFLDLNRFDLAAKAFGRAVRLRPDYADAVVNYAEALAQTGRYAEATEAFEQAARLQPQAADVHNDLGGLLARQGRLADARAQFEEALRLQPDFAEARRNLARVEALEAQPGQR